MPIPNEESTGLQTQVITDLSGGMVTNVNYTRVQRNQYQRLLNGDLSRDGNVQTRSGRTKLTPNPFIGNPTVNSLFSIGQSTGGDLILAKGGSVLDEVSTGNHILVKNGLNVDAYLASTIFDNYAFCCDGVDVPFITQGAAATTYQTGITASPNLTGFTVTAGAGGDGTDGTHLISFRYRSTITGARSNPLISGITIQSTSVVLGGGNNTYHVTFPVGLVSPDPQVDIIDYFAQEANANDPFFPYYYLGSSANTAGTYDFGTLVADDDLIVLERLDTDDNLPYVTMKQLEQWRGRVLGIRDDYHVVFSKQRIDQNGFTNLPTSWPPENELEVGFGDGDPLIMLINFQDYIFAFKRRSIWFLNGDFNSADFGFVKLKTSHSNVGAINQRSVIIAGDRVFFVTDDLKFYYFRITDFSTEQLRLTNEPPSQDIGDLFTQFASAYRQNINLINYTFAQINQVWINFTDGSSGLSAASNFNTFVYDYVVNEGQGAWSINTGNEIASGILARDNQNNYYVYSGDYYGFVWKHATLSGDGALINGTSTGGNAANTFNDLTASFTTAEIGCFLQIIDGTGAGQIVRITGVPSSTQYTVTPNWPSVIPNNTSVYTVGGINFQLWSRDDWCNEQVSPLYTKLGWYLDLDFENFGIYDFTILLTTDRQNNAGPSIVVSGGGGSVWGPPSMYGVTFWGDTNKLFGQVGFNLYFKTISHRIINQEAGQPFRFNGWTYTFQTLEWMRKQ